MLYYFVLISGFRVGENCAITVLDSQMVSKYRDCLINFEINLNTYALIMCIKGLAKSKAGFYSRSKE